MNRALPRRCHFGLTWWCVLLGGLPVARVQAANILPASGKPTSSGISILIDRVAPESPGYVPFQVTINASPPAQGDRTFQFEIETFSRQGQHKLQHVEQEIVLPGGATTAQANIAVPGFLPFNSYSVRTWQEGYLVQSLCGEGLSCSLTSNWWGSAWGTSCSTLFVETNPPLVQDYITALHLLGVSFSANSGAMVNNSNPNVKLSGVDATMFATMRTQDSNLPTRWIDYSTYGVICVSSTNAQRLAKQEPTAWSAMGDWVRSGGNLIIYDVDGAQPNAEFDRLLWRTDKPQTTASESSPQPWRRVNESWLLTMPGRDGQLFQDAAATVEAAIRQPNNGYYGNTPSSVGKNSTAGQGPKVKTEDLSYRDLDLGRIVVLASPDPFAGDLPHLWHVALTTIGRDRWDYQSRHGLSLESYNGDFWTFLIAGVGLAPVNVFRVLITLFVLAVGPVNYYLLKRVKRLYLMLYTVPLIALLVTTSLFAYGLVSDGFSTQMRIRAFSMLDAASGKLSTAARLSYYSGLAPSSGLMVSPNTEFVPIHADSDEYEYFTRRDVSWTDKQQLQRGYFTSRTPLQYITTSVRPSQARMDFAAHDGSVTAVNRLGAPVLRLLACDENGKLFAGNSIPAGESRELVAATGSDEICQAFARVLKEAVPQPPAHFYTRSPNTSWRSRSRYYNAQPNTSTMMNGRLEWGLAQAASLITAVPAIPTEPTGPIVDGHVALPMPDQNSMSLRRKFVALLPSTSLLDLGIQPDIVDNRSVHVLLGSW